MSTTRPVPLTIAQLRDAIERQAREARAVADDPEEPDRVRAEFHGRADALYAALDYANRTVPPLATLDVRAVREAIEREIEAERAEILDELPETADTDDLAANEQSHGRVEGLTRALALLEAHGTPKPTVELTIPPEAWREANDDDPGLLVALGARATIAGANVHVCALRVEWEGDEGRRIQVAAAHGAVYEALVELCNDAPLETVQIPGHPGEYVVWAEPYAR